MTHQLVFIHGIGKTMTEKVPYGRLAEPIEKLVEGTQSHFVRWHDLGFSKERVELEEGGKPFDPPFEKVLGHEESPFLLDRLGMLLQIRQRDVKQGHPAWTFQTRVHQAELRLVGLLLDYIGDVEVYLRDEVHLLVDDNRLAEAELTNRRRHDVHGGIVDARVVGIGFDLAQLSLLHLHGSLAPSRRLTKHLRRPGRASQRKRPRGYGGPAWP